MKKKSASHSAPARRNPWLAVVFGRRRLCEGGFFTLRLILSVLFCFAAVTIILLAQPRPPSGQSGQQPIIHAQYRGVMRVLKFDISPKSLRDIVPLPVKECTKSENEGEGPIPPGPVGLVLPDKAVQRVLGKIGIPGPIITFDGNSNSCGCSPPDPNGAVGPNHVVTMSNLAYQIFNKTGQTLAGPNPNNSLWAGFGGNCEMQNAGDPVVLYDQLADRWLFTQFTSSAPYLECVALSQTHDPTGFYYRWAIETGSGNNFPDYPKVGMWPDAYYFSTREVAGGSTFVGVGAYALDRAQALNGNPNPTVVGFLAPPNPPYVVGDGLLPSDLDGMTPPPVGSPNYFVGSEDNNGPYGAPSDALTIWKFHYDPMTPSNSTFTLTNTLPTQPFNSILGLCGGFRACIPQPGTTNRIDHLGYRQRPLFRLAYRNFGSHESLVTNQSVSAGTGPSGEVSGIRWWELRSPGNNPFIFQEGTYAPGLTDGIHRWMASIAMNSLGDIAMSYSASDGTATFPSVYYTARHAGDPPGQMTLGEGSIINGTGSQTGSNKWGDYTSIDIDPVDDQTFWVVNEYLPTTSSVWRLRIGAFNLAPTPTPTAPAATPTATCSICFTPSPTPTPTASPTCSEEYVITQIGGSIVPGTTDIGNHSDDLVTIIPLPFTYQLYHTNMGPIRLSSNGNAQFTTIDSAFDVCLPWLNHGFTVFPYWDDQRTDAQTGCSGFPGGTCGIYTSISGSAPNRIFNIEWRTVYDTNPTQPANYELRLYEGQNRFDVIYGNVALGNSTATAGVQFDDTTFVQYFCSGSGGAASGGQSYVLQPCSTQTPSPTATATANVTPTATVPPSPTPTPSPAGCSVTSSSPPCGSIVVGTPPTDFTVNLSAPEGGIEGSVFMVNGTPANSVTVLSGGTEIIFHFDTSPVVEGLNTMHIPAGAFPCGEPGGRVQEFHCTFTYQPHRSTPIPRPRPTPGPRP